MNTHITNTIFVLVGYKGSGKTFIGKLFESEFGIKFLDGESVFLAPHNEMNTLKERMSASFLSLKETIIALMQVHNTIAFGSTGSSKDFSIMLNQLRRNYELVLIKIEADDDVCINRARRECERRADVISDHELKLINFKSSLYNYNFDFYLENNNKTTKELIEEIGYIIGQSKVLSN